jgi:CBS domain-containing protein
MSTALVKELKDILRSAPVIDTSSTCRDALRVMFQHPESKCMVVCNGGNEPLGLLMSESFYLEASGRHGTDMFYREPVIKYMNTKPLIADLNTPKELLSITTASRPNPHNNDCVIITLSGKFAGVVSISDLLR